MAEEFQINGSVAIHINGHSDDVQMADTDSRTLDATPGISGDFSMASLDRSSMTRSYPDDSDEHGEPPAKRARIFSSDVDMPYTAHVSPYFILPSVRRYGRADLACLFLATLPSQVCNSTPSFRRHFYRRKSCSSTHPLRYSHYIGSSHYHCHVSTRVYLERNSASLLLINDPFTEKVERRRPFSTTCRHCGSQHPPLPIHYQDPDGLFHNRSQTRCISSLQT